MNAKLLIFGPPGSGKGTLSDIFSSKTGIVHISTGDMFRSEIKQATPLGKQVKELIDAGNLVPDSLTNSVVKHRLSLDDVRNGFLLDGFPRTVDQALFLESVIDIDGVIFVDLEDEKIIDRITHRRVCSGCGKVFSVIAHNHISDTCDRCGGKLIQRADDTVEVISNRLATYKELTHPIMDLFDKQGLKVLHIKGDYDIKTETDLVVQKIIDFFS